MLQNNSEQAVAREKESYWSARREDKLHKQLFTYIYEYQSSVDFHEALASSGLSWRVCE